MQCPKCNYERKESDTAPDWQCPNCGIAVAKYVKLMEDNDQHLADLRQDFDKRKKVYRKQYKAFFFLVPIILFSFVAPKFDKIGFALFWFLLSAWTLYCAFIMQSTGYFIAGTSRVISKEERPLGFKLNLAICIFSAGYFIVIGVRCIK